MRRLRQIELIVLLIVIISGSSAAEELVRPVRISTTVNAVLETGDSALGKVISDAVDLQLRLDGFEVTSVGKAGWPPPKNSQDYLVQSDYAVTDDEITVEILCMETGDDQRDAIASGRWTGPLTLEMDREIQKLVNSDITPVLPEYIEVTQKETERAAEAGEAWAIAILPPVVPGNAEVELAESAAMSRWRIGIVGAVYLPLSDTASFADTGYGGTFSAGYAFKAGAMNLGLGITAGAMYFNAEAAESGHALFIPIGAELRIGAALSGALQPWLKLTGGLSWFQLAVDGSDNQSKFVPFAEGGVGLDIFFGRTFGLSAEASFRFVFEGSVILYHVAPGIGAVVRF